MPREVEQVDVKSWGNLTKNFSPKGKKGLLTKLPLQYIQVQRQYNKSEQQTEASENPPGPKVNILSKHNEFKTQHQSIAQSLPPNHIVNGLIQIAKTSSCLKIECIEIKHAFII